MERGEQLQIMEEMQRMQEMEEMQRMEEMEMEQRRMGLHHLLCQAHPKAQTQPRKAVAEVLHGRQLN
jgi:hypothetical protein